MNELISNSIDLLKDLLEISFIGFIVGLHWIFFFESIREHTRILCSTRKRIKIKISYTKYARKFKYF